MQLRHVLAAALLALPASAQTPDTSRRASGAIVSGAVYDSLARAPLAGAVVQLVAADSPARFGQTVFSDSLGRYAVPDVPVGRYRVGFFHPMLDSLGVEPPLREVQVDGQNPVRADLAIPFVDISFRTAVCGAQISLDAGSRGRQGLRSAGRCADRACGCQGRVVGALFCAGRVASQGGAPRRGHGRQRLVRADCDVPKGGTMMRSPRVEGRTARTASRYKFPQKAYCVMSCTSDPRESWS